MGEPWHIVVVLAGSARLVVARLHKELLGDPAPTWSGSGFSVDGLDVYLPLREVRLHRAGRVRFWRTPLFGPYMFARFDVEAKGHENHWPLLSRQPGVLELLHVTGGIAAVDDAEIATIRAQENAKGVIPHAIAQNVLKLGDQVRITDGPFQHFNGPVEEIDTRVERHVDYRGRTVTERVAIARVRVTIFGRESLTEVEERFLEPL